MEKGNKKKRELQNALKMLAIEKGYANVTMKDIGEYIGLSVGGLYHHYHDV
nr:TetR/AcrR family transcriptional regulator [Lachnospiraceae bacterium]